MNTGSARPQTTLPAPCFTASQFAAAIGRSPQSVRQRLNSVRESGLVIVQGNLAKVWEIASLPATLQKELEDAALCKGHQDALQILRSQAKEKAGDAAASNISQVGIKTACDHAALGHRLAFQNPADPTLTERLNAFEYSFVHFEQLLAVDPGHADEIKCSIRHYLWKNAPSLARSPGALKRTWNRKLALWRSKGRGPAAIADLRPVNSGKFCLDDLEADLQLIVSEAFHHDGKLSIAIRKLRKAGKLSQTFLNRYTLDVRRDKSYVAKSIRQQIKERLTGLLDYRRSKWAVNMAGPRIARDWSRINPGDFFAADDCTFNIVWHYIDDNGRPAVTRGEVLLFFDCRSLYPLGYVLVPGHYNGETIRRGIMHIHDNHGLSHRGYIFERGIFESRLVLGSRPRDFLGWDEYEMGLRERGLAIELRNVTTPGAKVIEGIFNILQQNQRNERGFVGFNEREYGQEKLQKFIGRVKRGLVHPSKEFHSDAEWCQALDRSLEYYMDEPQNGELLRGQSPAEAFAACKPLRKLPDDARFLLASHRVRAKVKSNGLTIQIRGKSRSFYNEALGHYCGRNVYAWFNLEQPDLLTVTDLDMKNPITVQRRVLPAFDATNEQLADVNRDRHGFLQSARVRFDQIKHPERRSIVRDNVIDADVQVLGEHIRAETERFAQEKTVEKQGFARLLRTAEAAGASLSANIRNADRVRQGIEMETEWREERRAEEFSADQIPAPVSNGGQSVKKNYILNSPPSAAPSIKAYFALWARVEKATKCDPNFRHALTQKHLGGHPRPRDMTPEQLAKMMAVFSAILRDAKKET